MKTAEIIDIIGKFKGIRLTDLSTTSYDLAIVLVAHEDVRKQPYEIKINPTFLARELGMDVEARPEIDLPEEPTQNEGETDELFEKRLVEYNKLKNAALKESGEFIANRSKLSRKWLTTKAIELKAEGAYVRVSAEQRIVGETGYSIDESGKLKPHQSSGLFMTRISVADEEDAAEYKILNGSGTVDDKLKIQRYLDEKKREVLRAKADEICNSARAKFQDAPKPKEAAKPEEPAFVEEGEDDSAF